MRTIQLEQSFASKLASQSNKVVRLVKEHPIEATAVASGILVGSMFITTASLKLFLVSLIIGLIYAAYVVIVMWFTLNVIKNFLIWFNNL